MSDQSVDERITDPRGIEAAHPDDVAVVKAEKKAR